MTLPASGAISLSQVSTEMNQASNTTISLGDAMVRSLSGTYDMDNLHGKSRRTGQDGWGGVYQVGHVPGVDTVNYFTVPYGCYSITAYVVGAGGGGSGVNWQGGDACHGGGGGAGGYAIGTFGVTPQETLTVVSGGGGMGSTTNGATKDGKANSTSAGGNSYVARGGTVLIAGYGGRGATPAYYSPGGAGGTSTGGNIQNATGAAGGLGGNWYGGAPGGAPAGQPGGNGFGAGGAGGGYGATPGIPGAVWISY